MICWFKQEECSHLMPASLVYSKSVIECLLHCLLNIPRNIGDAFFYVSSHVPLDHPTVHAWNPNPRGPHADCVETWTPRAW